MPSRWKVGYREPTNNLRCSDVHIALSRIDDEHGHQDESGATVILKMSGNQSTGNKHGAEGAKWSPHTIRFRDAECDHIIESAESRGVTPTEFVRSATFSVTEQVDTPMAGLAELIKRTTHPEP